MGLGIAVFSLPLLVAAAPNMSGSWVRDASKSQNVPDLTMWLTRSATTGRGGGGGGAAGAAAGTGRGGGGGGRQGGPGARGPAPTMSIQQDAANFTVTETNGTIHTYKLDGKPSPTEMDTEMAKASIVVAWQGDKLVITSTEPYGGMPGNVGATVKEEWSLSPDGKTLTRTTTESSPATTNTYQQVYNKQ